MSWVILETVEDRSKLIEREQVWLDQHKGRLYNKSPTAASRLGAIMSDEARAKISASLKGNQYRKGKPHPPEDRAKIGAAVRAANNSGRRKQGAPQPENLRAYNEAIKRGDKRHPRTNLDRERAIVADYLVTKSQKETGRNFGVTGEAISYILKKNGIRKFKRTNYAKRKRIHRGGHGGHGALQTS